MTAPNVVAGPWAAQPASLPEDEPPFDATLPPAPPEDEEGEDRGGGSGGGGDEADADDFGPIVPLGVTTRKEKTAYVMLDAAGKQTVLSARDVCQRDCLSGLFGGDSGIKHLLKLFPNLVEVKDENTGEVTYKKNGWSPRAAGNRIMGECTRLGDADQLERRLDGVWRGDGGGLVVHTGTRLHLFPQGEVIPAGRRVGGALYLRARQAAEPSDIAATAAQCEKLRAAFDLWAFAPEDAKAAPILLNGMIACGIYAGALSWRPHMWLRGESNAGKSTLADIIIAATGADRRVKGASEAFTRRKYDGRAKLAMLDEQEPDIDLVNQILVLMRGASDAGGGRIGKVIDGETKEFVVACPFLIAAISTPAFEAQDESRITTLKLVRQRLEDPTRRKRELEQALAMAEQLHPALLTRLLLGWPRFQTNLSIYRQALMARGATPRFADQHAPLFAGHRTLVNDMPVDASTAAEDLDAAELRVTTGDDAAEGDAGERVLSRLFATRVPVGLRNESMTVAALVEKLRGAHRAHADAKRTGTQEAVLTTGKALDAWTRRAGALLLRWSPGEGLVIGNGQPLLDRAFDDTPWGKRVWERSLRDLPGARDAGALHFRGARKARAVLLPEAVLGLEADSEPAPEPPPD